MLGADPDPVALSASLLRPRRTPAEVLGWFIDELDGYQRPRRASRLVLQDIKAELKAGAQARQALERLGTPTFTGDTLPAGVGPTLNGAEVALRNLPLPAAPSADRNDPSSILHDLDIAEVEAWNAIAEAKRQRKITHVTHLIDTLRRLKETRLKVSAQIKASPTPPGWAALQERILQALAPYPEARQAVIDAISKEL